MRKNHDAASKAKVKYFSYSIKVFKKSNLLIYWTAIILLLLIAGVHYASPPQERRLFSDQATHISAALSILYDHDLEDVLMSLHSFPARFLSNLSQ